MQDASGLGKLIRRLRRTLGWGLKSTAEPNDPQPSQLPRPLGKRERLHVKSLLSQNDFSAVEAYLSKTAHPRPDWARQALAVAAYQTGNFQSARHILANYTTDAERLHTLDLELRSARQDASNSGITVVLTGYRRPQNLQKQLDAINAQTVLPTEILLWNNYGGEDIEPAHLPGVKAAYCNHNFKFHSRFVFAMIAKTKYVAIFDDDTIPGKRWFENCLNTMATHPGILGATGIQLKTSEAYRPHIKVGWNGSPPNESPEEVDLAGHAWFLEKKWLHSMWLEEPFSWDNGEDIHLSYTAKKFAGVRTYVPPHPPSDRELWGSTQGLELGDDAESTFMQSEKNLHTQLRSGIVKHACQSGWELVNGNSRFKPGPKIKILIPSFNRPKELARLLAQIDEQARDHFVSVSVFDDGSKTPVRLNASKYKNIDELTVTRFSNHGKRLYWKLVDSIFYAQKCSIFDHYYFLADDIMLVDKFFNKSISLWNDIADIYKVGLNLILDQRECDVCWTNYPPHLVVYGDTKVYRCQWLDMVMMFDRSLLESLNFRIKEVPSTRWDNDPLRSSGVGEQISHALNKRQKSMFQVTQSLVIHGDHPSVMNPEERERNPIVSRSVSA